MELSTLTAIAEPGRYRIVEHLKNRPGSVNELAVILGMKQPQVSKHLRTLKKAGIVRVQPYAQQRIYALNTEPFLRLEDWVQSFHSHWGKQFDNLEDYLKKGY